MEVPKNACEKHNLVSGMAGVLFTPSQSYAEWWTQLARVLQQDSLVCFSIGRKLIDIIKHNALIEALRRVGIPTVPESGEFAGVPALSLFIIV